MTQDRMIDYFFTGFFSLMGSFAWFMAYRKSAVKLRRSGRRYKACFCPFEIFKEICGIL